MKRNVYMTDELQAIYDHTVEFVRKEVTPHGEDWEEAGRVPREVLVEMGSLGMLGLRVPEKWGGLGLGPLASATFSEALGASTFAGFDVTVLVHTDMAGPHLINSGTTEQLERWMPGVVSGETILSIGVSEPDAGSDVAGIRTRARKDGAGWRIDGTKTFITNSVYGDLSIIAARTDDDRQVRDLHVPRPEGHGRLQRLEEVGQARLEMLGHGRAASRRSVGAGRSAARNPAPGFLRDDAELPERADGARRYGRRGRTGGH
jgi:alkylation response protein AidB-like acyl-CoA dehydrogenase